ncbi:beta-galactosidase 7-like [Gossypium australe]|uniref:beta-galactosidase n=1 Tax=Gossypium australe TaxID=47621 RepID=A0A5B6W8I2_9ROSI|nr:beta-galactosidase 7-like [Gossypium australe]
MFVDFNGKHSRRNHLEIQKEMETSTTKIVNMVKVAKLFAPQGGPIIVAQIENEYGNFMKGYGAAGKKYIEWCAKMAVAQNISVPPMVYLFALYLQNTNIISKNINCFIKTILLHLVQINTCNGFYRDNFKPNNLKSPKMWTENWTEWFKLWGSKDPHRTAEYTAFAVARFFQMGGVLNTYYMYHGGTKLGCTSDGLYITTSYDYDAPLDEFSI